MCAWNKEDGELRITWAYPTNKYFFCLSPVSPNVIRDVAVWWVRLTRIFGTIKCHSVFLIMVTWWLTRRITPRPRSCLHTWICQFVPSVSFTHGSVGWVKTQNLHSMLIDELAGLSWPWVHCEDRHGNYMYPTWLAFVLPPFLNSCTLRLRMITRGTDR